MRSDLTVDEQVVSPERYIVYRGRLHPARQRVRVLPGAPKASRTSRSTASFEESLEINEATILPRSSSRTRAAEADVGAGRPEHPERHVRASRSMRSRSTSNTSERRLVGGVQHGPRRRIAHRPLPQAGEPHRRVNVYVRLIKRNLQTIQYLHDLIYAFRGGSISLPVNAITCQPNRTNPRLWRRSRCH